VAIDGNRTSGVAVSNALSPLLDRIAQDEASRVLIEQGLEVAAKYIDEGRFSAQDLLRGVSHILGARLKDAPVARGLARELLGTEGSLDQAA
jgi:transcriptional accessory protein Tex/SPT6